MVRLWNQKHPFLSMYDDLQVDLASYFTMSGLPLSQFLKEWAVRGVSFLLKGCCCFVFSCPIFGGCFQCCCMTWWTRRKHKKSAASLTWWIVWGWSCWMVFVQVGSLGWMARRWSFFGNKNEINVRGSKMFGWPPINLTVQLLLLVLSFFLSQPHTYVPRGWCFRCGSGGSRIAAMRHTMPYRWLCGSYFTFVTPYLLLLLLLLLIFIVGQWPVWCLSRAFGWWVIITRISIRRTTGLAVMIP